MLHGKTFKRLSKAADTGEFVFSLYGNRPENSTNPKFFIAHHVENHRN